MYEIVHENFNINLNSNINEKTESTYIASYDLQQMNGNPTIQTKSHAYYLVYRQNDSKLSLNFICKTVYNIFVLCTL